MPEARLSTHGRRPKLEETATCLQTQHFDVIIIGTGAGGGTLARALSTSDKRILILERGDYLPREKENWDPGTVIGKGHYKAHETWLDKDGHEFHPGIHYWVGGNTKVYGSALIRFRKQDFGELRHYGGTSLAWPIRYEELEPYYSAAERLYRVHGLRGSDPTEPPASAPFPHAAVSHEPAMQELVDGMKAIGHQPFPMPLGINLNEADREASQCLRCNTCDGFPCMVDGKSDAHVVGVRPALENPNVTLLTGALVQKLETNASGSRIERVVVERAGKTEHYSADVVVVAAGAVNSAALFLRSANVQAPRWPGQRLGHGRSQLHGSPEQRRGLPELEAEPDRVSKNDGAERLLLRRR